MLCLYTSYYSSIILTEFVTYYSQNYAGIIGSCLAETSRDTTSIQVVIVQAGEGEQLLLRDMKRTFMVTPILPVLASRSPTSRHEDSDYKEGAESFTAEMT